MENKAIQLKFRVVNRDIFNAVKSGQKKIETRVATDKYRAIKVGAKVTLICGGKKIIKQVSKVEIFKSISAVLKKYKPEEINPKTHTAHEARDMWYSFPGYKEKIRQCGLIVIHLK